MYKHLKNVFFYYRLNSHCKHFFSPYFAKYTFISELVKKSKICREYCRFLLNIEDEPRKNLAEDVILFSSLFFSFVT